MAAKYLEGNLVAEAVLNEVRKRTLLLKEKGVIPGLGTIIVGDDAASAGYVKKKHETCKKAGFASVHKEVKGSQKDLLFAVDEFNQNPDVDGFLIQYPLPSGFDFNQAVSRMNPAKDSDGLHPVNLGKLVLQEDAPLPCTPAGIQAMLKFYNLDIQGKEVVIVGRGPTLGRPLSLLLTLKQAFANAAVTVVHTGIPDIGVFTKRADLVIAAAGVPGIVKPEMVKTGAIVISGGISWEGKKLLPDVDVRVGEVASWITPRLGGVGPVTVAMLLLNTVKAAEKRK